MEPNSEAVRRAIAARDAASTRVRLLTGVVLAGAAALTGVFAAFAAGSTHMKKVVATHPAKAHPLRSALVVAPAPPLVAVNEAPSEGSAPAPPAQSPGLAPPAAPAVVVSGGS